MTEDGPSQRIPRVTSCFNLLHRRLLRVTATRKAFTEGMCPEPALSAAEAQGYGGVPASHTTVLVVSGGESRELLANTSLAADPDCGGDWVLSIDAVSRAPA